MRVPLEAQMRRLRVLKVQLPVVPVVVLARLRLVQVRRGRPRLRRNTFGDAAETRLTVDYLCEQ